MPTVSIDEKADMSDKQKVKKQYSLLDHHHGDRHKDLKEQETQGIQENNEEETNTIEKTWNVLLWLNIFLYKFKQITVFLGHNFSP